MHIPIAMYLATEFCNEGMTANYAMMRLQLRQRGLHMKHTLTPGRKESFAKGQLQKVLFSKGLVSE